MWLFRSLVRFPLDIWVIDAFPSCRTMGPGFWLAVTLPILVFLQIICWVTGRNNLIPPDSRVIGIIGNDTVLPCQLQRKIILEKLSVQWIFAGGSTEREVATFDGKITHNPFLEFEAYWGRTAFFPLEFHQGNLSLLLKNVQPSDKGKYTCVVFLENWYNEVVVELDVAVQGAEPSVFLEGHSGNGISLSCRSQGWFPEPSVLWLDSQGRPRPEEVTTRSTPGHSSGIYDVVSSMRLEPGSDQEVSCRVVNEVLNATRESRVRIADSFFPSTSPWMIVSLLILTVDLGILGAVVYKMKRSFTETRKAARLTAEMRTERDRLKSEQDSERSKKRAEGGKLEIKNQLERLRAELDFWEARSHAVPVVLDPKAQPLKLRVQSHLIHGPVLLARQALGAGKHYWEVELSREQRREQHWALGVLRDGANLANPHSDDCWALCCTSERLFSSCGSLVRSRCWGLSVLGVFLDSEKKQLEFYDVEKRVLVARMALQALEHPMGKFFPFVSRGKKRALSIHPVPIPVPLKSL